MQLSVIDILFLVTVGLLVFSGLRQGAVFSLLHLLGIPIAFLVSYFFGSPFIALLNSSNLPATPLIAYVVLFLGTMLIVHIIGSFLRGVLKAIPGGGLGDALLGALIGFVEAWVIWLVLLIVLGNFLNGAQTALAQGNSAIPGLNLQFDQLTQWHNFYMDAINHSLFAQVNRIFLVILPNLPQPK